MTHENIKYIIASFILFFSIIISAVLWFYVTTAYDRSMQKNIETTSAFINDHLSQSIQETTRQYIKEVEIIFSDPDVISAFKENEGELLRKNVKPYFQRFKKRDPGLLGMHVVFPGNASFVNIHEETASHTHDDDHDPLLQKALEEKKAISRFETKDDGYFFTVSIPVVTPEENRLGLAEFILDANAFIKKTNDGFDHQSAFLIKSEEEMPFLKNRQKSADGYKIYFPTSDLFERFFASRKAAGISSEDIFSYDGRHYGMALIGLDDVSNDSKIAILYDITSLATEKENFFYNFTLFTTLTVIILSTVVYFIILYFVRIIQNKEKETAENAQKILQLARTNQVTGLPNSMVFFEDIKKMEEFTAIILDVENFSIYNTFYGMAFSDSLLECSAAYLLNNIPGNGKLYHINADKFVITLNDPINKQEFQLISQIKSYFEQKTITLEGVEIPASFSFGIVPHADEDCLLKGNIAIRESKKRGKGQVTYFHSSLLEDASYAKLAKQMIALRMHLEEDNIVPFYQPIINLKTNKIEKYECLARIACEDQYKTPDEFIDAGEESGLISAITKSIINKSFEQFSNNRSPFSINVTKQDIIERYLPEFLHAKAQKHRIDPKNITLEILENIAAEEDAVITEQINRLQEEGFVIAIDDFGRGHSSFSRFMELHVEFIKIDGLFIKDIHTNEKSLKIVKSIVHMAHSLGMKTVAEYVHNEEVSMIVREIGVDYAQGYYYSKPLENI